ERNVIGDHEGVAPAVGLVDPSDRAIGEGPALELGAEACTEGFIGQRFDRFASHGPSWGAGNQTRARGLTSEEDRGGGVARATSRRDSTRARPATGPGTIRLRMPPPVDMLAPR